MIENKSILISTPYCLKNKEQAQKLIPSHVFQKIKQKEDKVTLDDGVTVLMKRNLQKPIYMVKCKKYRHKQSGQVVRIVSQIFQKFEKEVYDYGSMGSFINNNKQDQLQEKNIKKCLREKILSKRQNEEKKQWHIHNYLQLENNLKLVTPQLLKQYNHTPPIRDQLFNYHQKGTTIPSSICISFGQQIPINPISAAPNYISNSPLYKKIQSYLQKRPCFLRNALVSQLKVDQIDKCSDNQIKGILKYLCYTFRNGPWKNVYCLFGYDPQKIQRALLYQNVTIKLKIKQIEDYDQDIEQEYYDPTFTIISKKYARSYQLCDFVQPEIKQILKASLGALDRQCTKDWGWLDKKEYSSIMEITRKKLQEDS